MTDPPPTNDRGIWNPYVAGIVLGVVLFLALFLTGSGLGGSGGGARIVAFLTDLVAPGNSDRDPYLAPLVGGDRNPLNHPLVWQFAGILLGGFLSGLLRGHLKPEVQRGPRIGTGARLTLALLGGAMVGYGARLARGCTSGQALSGGAVISAGSWAFMFAVFAGGYLLAYPLRRAWR